MTNKIPVIAIDGPSGSGKGTVAQALADTLGWHYLDSGALYRAIGWLAEQQDLTDPDAIVGLLRSNTLEFRVLRDSGVRLWVTGEDVEDQIRTESSASAASRVAVMPEVRNALIQLQRQYRKSPGLVADGRDMGTVIFPDADVKIYLTASAEKRAQRRHNQLKGKEKGDRFDALFREIKARDERDASRSVSPLRPADDAVTLDTTSMSIEETVQTALTIARGKLEKLSP